MDVNDIRSIVTTLSALAFLGIVVWAFLRRNQAHFDEAARLPFVEDNNTPEPVARRDAA